MYKYLYKTNDEIDRKLKEEIYKLATKIYPDFRKYFKKNRYYSTVKPQLILLVFDKNKLIGYGKLLWRNLKLVKSQIKFSACGFIVDSLYQKEGIGTKMLDLSINQAKEIKADVLYASTTNPNAIKMLEKKSFKKITTKLTYTEALTNKDVEEIGHAYCLELTDGILKEINSLPFFHIGIGPV